MVSSSAATVRIQDAVGRDSSVVTSILTDVCVDTPFSRGLSSEASVRRELAQAFIGELVAETMAEGIGHVAVAGGEIVGAALWSMDQGASRRPTNVVVGGAEAASVPQVQRLELQELADDRCPPRVVHHRLLYLGVLPGQLGRHIEDDLLVNHHAMLHLMRLPALAIVDDLTVPLFQRHRYNTVGPPKLLAGGVPMSVMWRDPVPADPL